MPEIRGCTYTAQDEINYLQRLLLAESVTPNGGRHHVTGRQAFAMSAFLILTDRRRFDATVDAWGLKAWIRETLDADPGLGELLEMVKALWGVKGNGPACSDEPFNPDPEDMAEARKGTR